MAKEITAVVKLQLPAGKATAGPPVGSSLGPHGINIPAFTKEFNEKTASQAGLIIPISDPNDLHLLLPYIITE